MKKSRRILSIGLALTMVAGMMISTSPVSTATPSSGEERNLAYHRMAYQSSAVDFNETAELITDGIVGEDITWSAPTLTSPSGSTSGMFDDMIYSGGSGSASEENPLILQFTPSKPTAVTRYDISARAGSNAPGNWTFEGSQDGENWDVLDTVEGNTFDTYRSNGSWATLDFPIDNQTVYSYYRLRITGSATGSGYLNVAEVDFFESSKYGDYVNLKYSPFVSRWTSEGAGEQWVYVDLGAESTFDELRLTWSEENYATKYQIQVSDDAENWKTVANVKNQKGGAVSNKIPTKTARYVRVLMEESAGDKYSLQEMEVIGTNDLSYTIDPMPGESEDGTQPLTGGNWKVERESAIGDVNGEEVASASYDDSTWLPAVVPGTVLTSYLEAGAVPDTNVSDNQLAVSDSYFRSNFWYRNNFVVPKEKQGQKVLLNFDAVSWKAVVYFNGQELGEINGAYTRGQFDVTDLVNYGEKNYLAVRIIAPEHPGLTTCQDADTTNTNGGMLGADNPSIHASVGWDWVPTIRGRNIGLYDDVFLSYREGDIHLTDPWIETVFDKDDEGNVDLSKAHLTVRTEVTNPTDSEKTATVQGTIQPGNIDFSQGNITLAAGETKEVAIQVDVDEPQVWWPNTYGDQPLYTCEIQSATGSSWWPTIEDTQTFQFGIRQLEFTRTGEQGSGWGSSNSSALNLYCNGVRIFLKGGNWGMDDSNLAADAEDYDTKVRLHAEANFTMIRNWVGQTWKEEFYDACDKYGILIWDDFWLANPSDGPDPVDREMFFDNATDKIKRNRKHPSEAIYCARNEGIPPADIQEFLTSTVAGKANIGNDGVEEVGSLDGSRYYVKASNKEDFGINGEGPYTVQTPRNYFSSSNAGANPQLHTERGMPNFPAYESISKMLGEDHQWPMDDVWGIHDFANSGAQNARQFKSFMYAYEAEENIDNLKDFSRIAQMVNYEGHKAMFESFAEDNSSGLLMWMSQSAWPSTVWQIYDYYYDTNAGYYALKTASQPLNIIWNPTQESAQNETVGPMYNPNPNTISITNDTGKEYADLTARIRIYDMNGNLLSTQEETAETIAVDEVKPMFAVEWPTGEDVTPIKFMQCEIVDADGSILASNFYWENTESYRDYQAMSTLEQAQLDGQVLSADTEGDVYRYTIQVSNNTEIPAVMTRVKTMQPDGTELVLPTYYSDNYFALMPGQTKEISVEFDKDKLQGGAPIFKMEGFNTAEAQIEAKEEFEITVETDKDSYLTNESIIMTIVTPDDVDRVGLKNERGKYLGIQKMAVRVEPGRRIWTVTTSVGTAGDNRQISVVVHTADGWSDPVATAAFDVSIAPPEVEPKLLEVSADKYNAGVNEDIIVTVETTTSVEKISLQNERGKGFGCTVLSKEDRGDVRTWKIKFCIGTAGNRQVTVLGKWEGGFLEDTLPLNFVIR